MSVRARPTEYVSDQITIEMIQPIFVQIVDPFPQAIKWSLVSMPVGPLSLVNVC